MQYVNLQCVVVALQYLENPDIGPDHDYDVVIDGVVVKCGDGNLYGVEFYIPIGQRQNTRKKVIRMPGKGVLAKVIRSHYVLHQLLPFLRTWKYPLCLTMGDFLRKIGNKLSSLHSQKAFRNTLTRPIAILRNRALHSSGKRRSASSARCSSVLSERDLISKSNFATISQTTKSTHRHPLRL